MNLELLISQCINRDRVAQKELYESYKDSLYTVAYRITGDFDIASDLLQETFIEAFKQLSNLKQPKAFHGWIKQILVRKALRLMQKEQQNIPLESITETGEVRLSDVGYIERAIQALPLKSRTVFLMIEVEGFSHKEVADTMNISVGTSKSQLNYAKTKLRALLKQHAI